MRVASVIVVAILTTACGAIIGLEDVPPPSTVGVATPELSKAAQSYAHAYCGLLFNCQRGNFDFNFNSPAECETAVTASELDLATLPGSGATVEALGTCVSNLSALNNDCASFAGTQFGFACAPTGTKKSGEECFENVQCQTGFCGIFDAAAKCKTCGDPPSGNGKCGLGSLCPTGYQCNSKDTCVTFGRAGEFCNEDNPCILGFGCNAKNSCEQLPPIPPQTEATCDPKLGCDTSRAFICAVDKLNATEGKCVPFKTSPGGGECQRSETLYELCRRNAKCNDTTRKCDEPPKEGEKCTPDNSGPRCPFGLVCNLGQCTQVARFTCE